MDIGVEEYCSVLKKTGYEVRIVDNVAWYNVAPMVFTTVDPCACIDSSKLRLKTVLAKKGVVARFTCREGQGRSSYRLQVSNKSYDLTSLKQKSRNQTKRGLENFEVGPLSVDDARNEGERLFIETLERQGRKVPSSLKESWDIYYEAAKKCGCIDIWGARRDGELGALLIAWRMNGTANITILRSSKSLLKFYPNNALIYSYIRNVLTGGVVNAVSIGLESIQGGMSGLDSFKLGMGFNKEPIEQRVELRWPLSNRLIFSGLKKMVTFTNYCKPGVNTAKAVGMLQWWEDMYD